jgi:predicted nuclease of restriction endonuclease-like (RecB) superfamily
MRQPTHEGRSAGMTMQSDALTFEGLVAAIGHAHSVLTQQAVKAVNISLTLRNWFIGLYIAEFELQGANRAGYGDRLIPELAAALTSQNVSNTGRRQLYTYLAFYRAYPQIVRTASAQRVDLFPSPQLEEKVRSATALSGAEPGVDPETLLSQLSYSHFERLVEVTDPLKRQFYEIEALHGNWSVRELKRQIDTQYFERSALSANKTIAAEQVNAKADRQDTALVIRDPYVFEFLGLKSSEVVSEGDLEDALLDKLQAFLLELGHGFCFEARQKRLLIGGEHFFVDLVFYHRILKCHVLIELKNDAFKHEHLGQLNSYVSYYKENQMQDNDQPPIGILLCTRKNQELVEYALAGMSNSIFVSRYQVELPDKEQIAAFLHRAVKDLEGIPGATSLRSCA